MKLVCHGCGALAQATAPFRCKNAGTDDVDHVIERHLPSGASFVEGDSANPFLRYGTLMYSRSLAPVIYDEVVAELDAKVAAVDGRGFTVTPLHRRPELGFSGLWVKDETNNVSGSHKARHLMGLMVYLEVVARAGLIDYRGRDLAISSCGNAALAAAVIAAAARWPLRVFVPTWADAKVVERLEALGATVERCGRSAASPGDPCTRAFRAAVSDGAIPFSCQGTDAGLAVEGGTTLGYEMVSQLKQAAVTLDRLFIQVGGGALASGCMQAFIDAHAMGVIDRLPKLHPVQTEGAAPLARAFERLVADGGDLERAAQERSRYMWPWEDEPQSLAHGILDDETYDWFAIVRAMLDSGGAPVVVSEDHIVAAHQLARSKTDIAVDPTGTAGLAGLLAYQGEHPEVAEEAVGVLFTGVQR